jgi:hypothetical protein
VVSCIHDPVSPIPISPNDIQLKWNPSHSTEKMEDAITGLNWALSMVGGTNTNNSTNGFIVNGTSISLNLSQINFSAQGHSALFSLHKAIQNSDEYRNTHHIDLGRYITLLIGSSAHYYRIVDVPLHLKQVVSSYQIQPSQGFVNNSSISDHHRTIRFSAQNGLNQLFISTEVDSVNGTILEFETMELMANGQFKFAIFDADSHRISSAYKTGNNAGKPAKCMWCHESNVNPLFKSQNDYSGFLTFQQLQDTLLHFNNEIKTKQSFVNQGVNFTNTQAHTQMELQYIMFKQPSVSRLANEWGMTETEVKNMLANYTPNSYPEFPFLDPGYNRTEIEVYAPFNGLRTSLNVREFSPIEVNHID